MYVNCELRFSLKPDYDYRFGPGGRNLKPNEVRRIPLMNDKARNTALSPIRILLVEDNEHDRVAFRRALRNSEAAFEISVCERAEDALDMIPANKESIFPLTY